MPTLKFSLNLPNSIATQISWKIKIKTNINKVNYDIEIEKRDSADEEFKLDILYEIWIENKETMREKGSQ